MKQLIQHVRTGASTVAHVPAPRASSGNILVQVAASLVSAGTERMVVDFAEKNLLQKARSRPDLVRQTLDKANREGILTTLDAVKNRLDQPMALGYACAGTVIDVGKEVNDFQIGDRVACAGRDYAVHAQVVSVPRNLATKLPDGVDCEAAAFTTMAAVALQGIRLAELKLGENAVVIGLGLLGQLTVQMLKAAGCYVIGMDIQPARAELARQMGADLVTTSSDDLVALCTRQTNGHGIDAVLITADTKSNQPVEVAGEIARRKGVVVAVGAVGMHIPRTVYYEKELDFRISSSYGPGRYDPLYEEGGQDYPYAYVRWTENRNMAAFVQMVAAGQVNVKPLITHRFDIDESPVAYDVITGKTEEPFLGVLLTYPPAPEIAHRVTVNASMLASIKPALALAANSAVKGERSNLERVRLGVLGAGLFANATLLPAVRKIKNLDLVGIASSSGLSGRTAADRFGFGYCTTDSAALLADDAINTVAILTRHHLHAPQIMAALRAGKHVFVEKPLCLSAEELQQIMACYAPGQPSSNGHKVDKANAPAVGAGMPYLMVGFNRRFAPYVVELKRHLAAIKEPLYLHYRVNAGYIPTDHWTHDPRQGGGRLLGEGCHFIDLVLHLSGRTPQRITTQGLPNNGRYFDDNFVITIEFTDGSLATVSYLANGDKSFSKELLEVFGGGLVARVDDFRTLYLRHGSRHIRRTARLRQDKGHKAEWQALTNFLTDGQPAPMPLAEIFRTTQVTLAAQQSLKLGQPVELTPEHA